MESLYLYFLPAFVCIGLILMRATDQRGTQRAWTRGDVLQASCFALIPGINLFLAVIMLFVVLLETEGYDRFRNWRKKDF